VIEGRSIDLVRGTGIPRLEDSARRLWFVNLVKSELVVLDRSGSRAGTAIDALDEQSNVMENRPGSFWVNTRRGLVHVIGDPADASKLRSEGAPYERGVPKGRCDGTWHDAAGALWFSSPGRLYRIELP